MRFGGIVVAVALILGACSSDPAPKEPTTSAPSAAPTAPTMPPQAKEDSPEGAAAFVKHYIDVFNYAASTGDVDELSRLSSPDCKGCQSYITLYRDTYQAGGYFKDDGWKTSKVTPSRTSGGYVIALSVAAPETEYRSTSSSPTKIGESGVYSLVLAITGTKVTRFETRQD